MDHGATYWRNKLRNLLHSLALLAGMALLAGLMGFVLAGWEGVAWAVGVSVAGLLLGPRVSPRAVLTMYGARPVPREQAPSLTMLLEELSRRAGLPRAPTLYYAPTQIMNAFSVGGKEPAIAVTDGLLRAMDLHALAGVLAHELSHIRNNDMWVMGLADTASRVTGAFAFVGQALVLINLPLMLSGEFALPWPPLLLLLAAPLLSGLMQLGLSRAREFDADLEAARLTGDPAGLAKALDVMERVQGGWFERLFMHGRKELHPSLLRTHPKTEERVTRLLALLDDEAFQAAHPPLRMLRGHDRVRQHFPPVTRRPRWRPGGVWR